MNDEIKMKPGRAPEATNGQDMRVPSIDIMENADEYMLLADLPGVSNEGLEVALDRNELRLSGSTSGDEELAKPIRFERVIRVPDTIDVDGISAHLRQGVLTLRLPKSSDVKPRRIPVQCA